MAKFNDLSGKQFGRLTVIDKAEPYVSPAGYRQTRWLCKCECGTSKVVHAGSLMRGLTRSCGCGIAIASSLSNTRHGMEGSPTYSSWSAMWTRCTNARVASFAYCGARGISVCERWRDFACFLADMGVRPSLAHSLDRIDVNGNYEPGNCRWATHEEQQRNKRSSRKVVFQGESMSIPEAAAASGISAKSLWLRLHVGWPAEDLFVPVRSMRHAKKQEVGG